MHQVVEYILGGALVASGLQSPDPLVPAVMGGVILLYAASTKGAASAFRLLDRRIHRWFDPVLVVVQVAAALQPWVSVDNGTRAIMVAIAVVHAVVWMGSSFSQRPARVPRSAGGSTSGADSGADGAAATPEGSARSAGGSDLSSALGKKAGRLVGGGVKMARAARDKRQA